MIALLLLLVAMVTVNAAKPTMPAGHFKHPLTDMPRALDKVETNFHFPEHEDLKLPLGESLTVLCHIQNNYGGSINITAIMGSLNIAYQFNHYMQNYSYKPYGVVVKSDEEITLQYEFEIVKELETSNQEYALAHTVFYETTDISTGKPVKHRFSTTFFNQTVELYSNESDFESSSLLELLSIFLSTAVVILMLLGVYFHDSVYVKRAARYIHGSGKSKYFGEEENSPKKSN